jgi:hypothetical protein
MCTSISEEAEFSIFRLQAQLLQMKETIPASKPHIGNVQIMP